MKLVGIVIFMVVLVWTELNAYKRGQDDGYEEATKDFAAETGIKMEMERTYTKMARTRRFLRIG